MAAVFARLLCLVNTLILRKRITFILLCINYIHFLCPFLSQTCFKKLFSRREDQQLILFVF